MSIILFILYFLIFSLSIIIFQANNPIYSVLSLICSSIGISFILFFLGFEFLPYLILMIYVGAVIILFLFIVMMVNLNWHFHIKINVVKNLIYFIFFIKISTFYYILIYNIKCFDNLSYSSIWAMNFIYYKQSDIILFGNSLYYYFSGYTLIVSVLLLLGMVGSISICLSNKKIFYIAN